MEGLGIDNILDGDELSSILFGDNDAGEATQPEENEEGKQKPNNEETDTAEIDPDTLFDDTGESESVGSEEENNKGNKEDTTSQESGTSPDFFSSIATAFAEEGIFPDLDEETINNIKDAQSFREAIVKQMNAGLTEQQRRVIEYTEIPSIIYNEFFTLAMVSIEDDGLEKSLRQRFKEDLINNSHDFIYYKDQYYKSLNIKNNIMHLFI